MTESDVLQRELPAGSEGGSKCEKDDFEHPNILYPGHRNSNNTNLDGIIGRHRGQASLGPVVFGDWAGNRWTMGYGIGMTTGF